MRISNVYKLKYGLLIYLMVLFSSLVLFQFGGRTWFLYLQILFCIIMVVSTKKVRILPYQMINSIFLWMIVSAISGYVGNTVESYKKAAVIMALFMVPMYFSVSYLHGLIKKNANYLTLIVKALKCMCLLQLFWIPFQYIAYNFAGLDINKILFSDMLHFTEKTSFIRSWVYYPSGFTHHSAVLASLFVLAFFLFENLPIRILILIDSIICGNSTAFVGVVIALAMTIGFKVFDRQRNRRMKIKLQTILFCGIALIVGFYLFNRFSIKNVLVERILYLWGRLFGNQIDDSTSAHLQYFNDYFTVVKNGSLMQTLLGCGEGCSGYYISTMYNRYTSLGNWSIECDIVNIALCRGIIGFIIYYVFLVYIAIKGFKLDKRYFIVMISIIIQGFGYNVQWDYVFFVEIILFFTIKLGINFFEIDKEVVYKKW